MIVKFLLVSILGILCLQYVHCCPATAGGRSGKTAEQRINEAPIVVQVELQGSTGGYIYDDVESFRYFFKRVCVLKNDRGTPIKEDFQLSEYGPKSCKFHMPPNFKSGIVTMDAMGTRLDFFDSDDQSAGYSSKDVSVSDVKQWLGNSKCL